MRMAHVSEAVDRLRAPSVEDPWRVLLSGCLAGWACGVEGSDYGLGAVLRPLFALPGLRVIPFCPERHTLGVPRAMPDIHGGDGFAVLDGLARVLAPDGTDLTEAMVEGGREMVRIAQRSAVDFAILTDASAACGSQVISLGCRLVPDRRHQLGVGVAAALLLRAGIPVVSQRDHLTLGRLRARLQPGWVPPEGARDHHDHPWVIANLRRGPAH